MYDRDVSATADSDAGNEVVPELRRSLARSSTDDECVAVNRGGAHLITALR